MYERRFLRVLTISLILLCFGILLFFQISVYAQSDEDVLRSSSIIPFLGYPVYGVSPLAGAGFPYTGIGVGGLPYIQQISTVQNTPLASSAMNSYVYRDLLSMYGTQSTQFVNPFMAYGTNTMGYVDPLSQAQAQTMSYSNIFGVNINQGQGYYRDPLYMTAGKYMNYSSPVGGYSFDQAIAQSPFGGATHVSSELITPMTYYGTEINTAYGTGAIGLMPAASYGLNIQHAAMGAPLTELQGTMLLMATGSELSAMNRELSNQYMYTEQGMPFYANAAYFNPDSYGGSNWYFPGGMSSYEAGGVTAGGMTTGYAVTEEISAGAGYLPVYGGSFASYRAPAGTADGSVVTGSGAYGGWSGTGQSLAGWGTVSGGWGAPAGAVLGTTSGGSAGAATTGVTSTGGSGAIFSGWGAPGGAIFGTTSAGAWGGGGFVGGGMMGGGMMGGGMVGGGFVSGAGVSYGGAPGLGW